MTGNEVCNLQGPAWWEVVIVGIKSLLMMEGAKSRYVQGHGCST